MKTVKNSAKVIKRDPPEKRPALSARGELYYKRLKALLIKQQTLHQKRNDYSYPITAPALMPGVLPKELVKAPIAMDSALAGPVYNFVTQFGALSGFGGGFVGFPGYPRLAMLSVRPEYRMFAQSMATSLTREFIVLNSTETAGDETREKCKQLEQDIKDIHLRDIIHRAAEHDSYFGRGQILLDIKGHNFADPLVLSPKTIKKLDLKKDESIEKYFRLTTVEALWTTPKVYNASDPSREDFYVPTEWFMMGRPVAASRLLTIITRPVSDMLKPAFNFGGISMSQLAEPYVDVWLRARASVSDLISNFSIVVLATAMDQALQGPDSDGTDIFRRAELFTLTRDNQNLMLTDKEREELNMFNAPISGLDALQAQAQEQMCSVSHTPAVVLLGISPTGFGNLAEGEVRTYYDWIASQQEAYWRKPIETVINVLQLLRYGKIDPDIVVSFQPLYQMTPKELAEIRKANAEIATALIQNAVIDGQEERERLARDPESGYQGIDTSKVIEPQEDDDEGQTEENEDL